MTKACGECNLCCKHERIESIGKPKGVLCPYYCNGCSLQSNKPLTCRLFNCLWLLDDKLPDDMRPDRIGQYAHGNVEDGCLHVVFADLASGEDTRLVDYITAAGIHVLATCDMSLRIFPGHGVEPPKSVSVNWTLR